MEASPVDIDPRLQAVDAHFKSHVGRSLAEQLRDSVCLDIGCNTGAVSRDLVQHYAAQRVVGYDIDGSLITRAIRAVPRAQARSFSYVAADYVANDATFAFGRYDAAFCLSVTKWIHLNGGDAAVKRLFARIRAELKPGGYLVLEPQEFDTYARRKRIAPSVAENYAEISLRPDEFVRYLTTALDFDLMFAIEPPRDVAKGFQRSIYVLRRGSKPIK